MPLISYHIPPTSFLVRAPVFVRYDSVGVLARRNLNGSADEHRRQQLALCRGTRLVAPPKEGVVAAHRGYWGGLCHIDDVDARRRKDAGGSKIAFEDSQLKERRKSKKRSSCNGAEAGKERSKHAKSARTQFPPTKHQTNLGIIKSGEILPIKTIQARFSHRSFQNSFHPYNGFFES
jgi:hypothetical protein